MHRKLFLLVVVASPLLLGLTSVFKFSSDYGGCMAAYEVAKQVSSRELTSGERQVVESCGVSRAEYYRRVVELVRTSVNERRETLAGEAQGVRLPEQLFKQLISTSYSNGGISASYLSAFFAQHGDRARIVAAPLIAVGGPWQPTLNDVMGCLPCIYYANVAGLTGSPLEQIDQLLRMSVTSDHVVIVRLVEGTLAEVDHAYSRAVQGWSGGTPSPELRSAIRRVVFAALNRRGDARASEILTLDPSVNTADDISTAIAFRPLTQGKTDLHYTVAGLYMGEAGAPR